MYYTLWLNFKEVFKARTFDLTSVPAMVESRLKKLKESPKSSTWFKDHCLVFSDPTQLGTKEIEVTDVMKADFQQNVYRPYLQSVIDGRTESTHLISPMSVFDPRQLPSTEKELSDSDYGMEKMKIYCFSMVVFKKLLLMEERFSTPDVDPEETESEWKLFRRVIFVCHRGSTLQQVFFCFTRNYRYRSSISKPVETSFNFDDTMHHYSHCGAYIQHNETC